MPLPTHIRFLATLSIVVVSTGAGAQATTQAKPDSVMTGMSMGAMADHLAGAWKEMNAFHALLAATWHPAEQKNDLGPLKAKLPDLVKAAETWGASTPPMMPHSCRSDAARDAVRRVTRGARSLAALADSGAVDAQLKATLKDVHDGFEVVEKACGGHGEQK